MPIKKLDIIAVFQLFFFITLPYYYMPQKSVDKVICVIFTLNLTNY